jgi:hypothetical protein
METKREEEGRAWSLFNSAVAARTTSSMGSSASRIAYELISFRLI